MKPTWAATRRTNTPTGAFLAVVWLARLRYSPWSSVTVKPARSTVANVTVKTLRPLIVTTVARSSHHMTDGVTFYQRVGTEFVMHSSVEHGGGEYVRGTAHSNTTENFFSILKRGVYGTYRHVREAHLACYLGEFDFRYNTRENTDAEGADAMLTATTGKRLTYRRPRQSENT